MTVLIFSNSALLVQIFSEREVELLERVVELLGRGEVFTNTNNMKVMMNCIFKDRLQTLDLMLGQQNIFYLIQKLLLYHLFSSFTVYNQ